jgi:outer membrane lipoprotein SlyB
MTTGPGRHGVMSRLERTLRRARYAAIGGAVGGAIGGLVSRRAASTGAGVGALLGATISEKRETVDAVVHRTRAKARGW